LGANAIIIVVDKAVMMLIETKVDIVIRQINALQRVAERRGSKMEGSLQWDL